ncbi:MAG: uracil-DNA glycosylase [Methylococcales bacterium]|nr:uracil-DNA glycosylase [Methylococcales bacterium]
MDNNTRLQYLEAMGIDVWVSKQKAQNEELQSFYEEKVVIDTNSNDKTKSLEDKWSLLQKEVAECVKCTLCNTREQTVFGSGNKNADWMFIGEAPGQNEDVEGKPFLGQVGDLLTEMIRSVGLERDSVYIANILKCKVPNNKKPKVEEIKSCQNYLHQQIQLIQPKIILAVGRIAAQTLLGTNQPLSELRGVTHQFAGIIPLVVIYHPAYLLRSLLEKKKVWQDLQLAIKQVEK